MSERPGKVYLIGAGPGDPGLFTLRGAAVLARCDVVLYDALAHPSLLDFAPKGAELRFVGKRGGEYSEPQDRINAQLVELARAGRTVGRLKGGDPLMFGRGAEEALVLAREGIEFEIVPGVSSPVAASAYAGIPLTHRDHASSVLFLTGTAREGVGPDGHDWRRLATRAGSICVLMGMHRLREITASLIEHGRPASTPCAIVQSGTLPRQRTITARLDQIADAAVAEKMGTPALIIIGTVVELREQLRWFDRKPLFGLRVVVTRPRDQAAEMVQRLVEAGAEPVVAPTIVIGPSPDPERLRRAAREASTYDWVAFTSSNGVASFFDALAAEGLDARAFGRARVASIGPGTAQALAARGVRADVTPDEHRGEALAEALLASKGERGLRVLLPRAAVARDVFPEMVRAAGGEIDVVSAYETSPAPASEELVTRLERREVDVVTLTASSTASSLVAMLGDRARELLEGVTIASIGPITTETAERHGLRVAVTASRYTVAGLLDALEAHFGSRPRA